MGYDASTSPGLMDCRVEVNLQGNVSFKQWLRFYNPRNLGIGLDGNLKKILEEMKNVRDAAEQKPIVSDADRCALQNSKFLCTICRT